MKTLVRSFILFATLGACSPSNPPADAGAEASTPADVISGGDSSTPADSAAPADASAPVDASTPVDASSPADAAAPSDAGDARSAACAAYCTAVMGACTAANAQYPSEAMCLTACSTMTWELGTAGATSGNSIACRTYHAGAARTNAAVHCPHAGPTGGGVCQ
jgi:hypothetical protein